MSIVWDPPKTYTNHAIERFQERWLPWVGLHGCRVELEAVVARALRYGSWRLDRQTNSRECVWVLSDVRLPPSRPTTDMLTVAAAGTGWAPRILCMTVTHMGLVKTVLPPGAAKANRRPKKPRKR